MAPEGWKAGGRLTRSGAFSVVGEGCILPFLWLVLSWKQGQTLGKLSVINQVLAVWGPLLWGNCLTPWVVTRDGSLTPTSLT